MSENFFKPRERGKVRILPSMDFSSLYPSVINFGGNRARKLKIKKILNRIYDSRRN